MRDFMCVRLLRVAVAAILGVAFLTGDAAGAVPVDVNPDTSDNANVNAASGGRVNHMAAVPGDDDAFYLASEYGGVFRTVDAGVTWTRLDGHLPVVAWDVEVDPSNVNRVVASSWYDGRVDPLSGIQISSDAGTTWTHPATSWPDPALEGTASDNTPAGWSCSNVRTEPSGYGISILGSTFAVGTNCGLALSTDSGATWDFVDPTPASGASRIWDVQVLPGGIIDVCGDVDDHMRSTDSGATWVAGAVVPQGRCSLAVSPDEDDVVFTYASDNNVYESDDAGGTWFNLGNPQPQGRIPFVVTNQRANAGMTNVFDLWAGDVQLFRAGCTTPADTVTRTRADVSYGLRRWPYSPTISTYDTTPSPRPAARVAPDATRSPFWPSFGGSRVSTAPAAAPTIAPPRWPPIEMFGTVKVMRRLITRVGRRPDRMRSMRFSRATSSAPPISPKMAPDAPTVGAVGSSRTTPSAPPKSDTT